MAGIVDTPLSAPASDEGPATAAIRRRNAARHAAAAVLAVVVVAASSSPLILLLAGLGAVAALVVGQRVLLSWNALLGILLVTILFVPARRYALPIDLPYKLEPYRLVVLVLIGMAAISLLIDPAFRWRRLGFGGSMGFFLATSVLSTAIAATFVVESGLSTKVLGEYAAVLTVFAVAILVRLMAPSLRAVHRVLGVLVLGGAFLGVLALIERRTGTNHIYALDQILPLDVDPEAYNEIGGSSRFDRARAFGAAQHPLALGAELALLVPLGLYLAVHAGWPHTAKVRRVFWVGCTVLVLAGMVASVTRLTVVALAGALAALWWLRPRLLQALIGVGIPMLVLFSFLAGNAFDDLWQSFRPESGLVEEQNQGTSPRSRGRLADISPALGDVAEKPIGGRGFGTRQTARDEQNTALLDNAYLSRAVDTGIPGFAALVVLVLLPVRRNWRRARAEPVGRPLGDLATALTCTFIVYAISIFFYDGFAFYQPLLTFAVLLGVSGWLHVEGRATPQLRVALPRAPAPAGRPEVTVASPDLAAAPASRQPRHLLQEAPSGTPRTWIAATCAVTAMVVIAATWIQPYTLRAADARAVTERALEDVGHAGILVDDVVRRHVVTSATGEQIDVWQTAARFDGGQLQLDLTQADGTPVGVQQRDSDGARVQPTDELVDALHRSSAAALRQKWRLRVALTTLAGLSLVAVAAASTVLPRRRGVREQRATLPEPPFEVPAPQRS